MSADEAVSRHFYANLGADGLRRRSRPDWDAAVVDLAAGYLAGRGRILNLGCGYGRIAIPLTARGYRVIGLDHVPSPGSALGAPAQHGRVDAGQEPRGDGAARTQ
ncbi:MAG TPA: hypothetical protein VK836_21855 [Streptosporangiaceae bacterium]|nr:hypothetical protein [Streptosporangiaceae bacterium]